MRGNVIIDLQFGSTGKGLIAGYLAERDNPDTVCTAWAANAGHTYIDGTGRKFIHTMLANGIVSRRLKRILLGPGSLIDPAALSREIEQAGPLMTGVDLMIHPNAAVITQKHRDLEAGPMTKIGSTKKGVGEAMIERIRRNPEDHNTARHGVFGEPHPLLREHCLSGFVGTVESFNNALGMARVLQVEGAQGYSLSLYHGMYPWVTSRDVSTHQTLADCGVPWAMGKRLVVVGTARTFPIRVANRFDASGAMVGHSGPGYPDQREMEWSELGREPELTTVTKLPRRIFTWSKIQIKQAVHMCGANELFLNFLNYCPSPLGAQVFVSNTQDLLEPYECAVRYVGLGPTVKDVFDLEEGVREIPDMSMLRPYWGQK